MIMTLSSRISLTATQRGELQSEQQQNQNPATPKDSNTQQPFDPGHDQRRSENDQLKIRQ